MYIRRAAQEAAQKISATFPVLLVTGARQVGKTTMLRHLAEEGRVYISLDDPDIRYMAKTDPALFMQRYRPPMLIDEIQYAPELLPYIKMDVDESGGRGRFWLAGSQSFHMMKGVSESLAGRVGIMRLSGLSRSEIEGYPSEPFTTDGERLLARRGSAPKADLRDIYGRIWRGSMPALQVEGAPGHSDFYRSYIDSYIGRDIRSLSQVADETAFFSFMAVAAAMTARPVQYAKIAADVGVSAPTAKKWLSILVSSGIAALIQPYHNNALKRVVKTPILHFLDTGLCAYLLKWENAEVLERGAAAGAFLESYVFSEIYKSYTNAGLEPPLFYYRDRDQREIDLLIYGNGTLCPIEVKKAASPGAEAVRHFGVLAPAADPERFGGLAQLKAEIGTGAVVCLAEELLPIDRKNWRVPVWLI
ncbi:MAG: ATP-binding protein [Clostridiales Family XIII bacterium]|jgi:predicted AAA+ superfamily ATPase|nr:ATP-binding protein [Clostridiales Family XIII bacterium]